MKLVALMGRVEGPFSTWHGSDLEFLEAKEMQEHNPQPPDTTFDFCFSINSEKVWLTVPMHMRAHNACGLSFCHG
jgi:hypothetical protein